MSLLNTYEPESIKERLCKEEIQNFILQEDSCFERSLQKGHITGSAWLVNKQNTHALLLHHAKLDLWCQPGGHCDGNSDVLAVALKEAQEESGILSISPLSFQIFDVDIHTIPLHKNTKEHLHYDIRFLLQVTSEEEAIGNLESKALTWIHKKSQNIPSQEESILRMHRKWTLLTSY